MSFESDTTDVVLRQLKEEIAKIREEQFVATLPTNNVASPSVLNSDSGVGSPALGVTSIIPAVIRVTKDDGVIDLLNYDNKSPTKDFVIGDTVTGDSSGASAEIGDIDIISDDEGILTFVPGTLTGTFTDNEFLDTGSENNVARADGDSTTQTGRGHLNAGAGSIIADREDISSPFEIHFIDGSQQDGQTVYLRAQDGQTIRMKRALTSDSTTGNLDLDESFDIVENALVFFQYQVASNVSGTGGWVPLITSVTAGTGGGTAFQFPILYPEENLGTTSGVIDLALNQSDGHYKLITLDGDASLTFSNLPPGTNGFKFYVETTQDSTGGWVYTDLPDSVLFEASLLGQLQTAPDSKTLWQFSTTDGGINWHASVINPIVGGGQNQTPWQQPIDANDFLLFNASQIRFSQTGSGFSCPTDSTVQGMSGGILGIEWNVSLSQDYKWLNSCKLYMQLQRDTNDSHSLILFDEGKIDRTAGISFTHLVPIPALSTIRPSGLELEYATGHGTGQGAFHGFRVGQPVFPQFEIREDVVRSNVNFDMVTNNIINIDQLLFDGNAGFNPATDFNERRITGGSDGIEMNIPKISPFVGAFDIWFENDAETASERSYRFEKDRLIFGGGAGSGECIVLDGVLGIQLCNAGSITDTVSRVIINTGQNPNPPNDPQILEFSVSNVTKVEIDDGVEGFRMFTDIDMRTFNIVNVDVLRYAVDSGVIGFNTYGSAVESDGSALKWSVPPLKAYDWQVDLETVASLDSNGLNIVANVVNNNPLVTSRGFQAFEHSLGSVGMVDGQQRLVDNSGSFDVMFGTGGQIINLSDLTGGGDCPIICDENDMGDVSGSVDVDWSLANFHRATIVGNTTFTLINLPADPKWQDICLEVLQDGVGGHTVTISNPFANGFVPVANGGANRYTSWQIYEYENPAGIPIIQGFNKDGSAQGLAGNSWDGFAGYIHAKLSIPQVTSLTPPSHIEFDTVLSSNKITVSGGVGQNRGVFRGFTRGHTYLCQVWLSSFGTPGIPPAEISAQWFDRTAMTLLGTHGMTISMDDPKTTNLQQVGLTYFTAVSTSDSLEVQIIDNTGATGLHAGNTTADPVTFATIKDCGITQESINEEGPPPVTGPGGDNPPAETEEDVPNIPIGGSKFGEIDLREFWWFSLKPTSSANRYARVNQTGGNFSSPANAQQRMLRSGKIMQIFGKVIATGGGIKQMSVQKNGFDLFIQSFGGVGNIESQQNLDIAFEEGDLINVRTSGGVGGLEQSNWCLLVWYL